MSENVPQVSVIILTKNAGSRLEAVLTSVFACDFDNEVIVVDSGSSDQTLSILSRYPVRLIQIPPESFSHGGTRNLAAKEAHGKILVFLTQDAVPCDRYWLKNLIDNFTDPLVAGVFGRQIPNQDSSSLEKFYLSRIYPDSKIIKDSLDPDRCLLSDIFFSNVNSALRKSDWQRVAFDESLIMSEDQAWSKEMLKRRKRIVYDPKPCVYHSHKYGFFQLISRNFDSGFSLIGLVKAPVWAALKYQADFFLSGLGFFFTKKYYLGLIAFPFYEFTRVAGFFLGFNSHFLPLFLKRAISQNKLHWRKYPVHD